MRKRRIFSTVSAFAIAAVMTVGMSVTAFAAEVFSAGSDRLTIGITFKTPDGSEIEKTQIGNQTVILMPRGTRFILESNNSPHSSEGLSCNVYQIPNDAEVLAQVEGNGYSDKVLAYAEGALISFQKDFEPEEVFAGTDADVGIGRYINGENVYGATLDFNNLGDYAYFAASLYDNETGSVRFCFRYKDAGATATNTSSWASDSKGWWIQNSDGTYLTNTWHQSNGQWYYMGADGYMLTNTTTPDGYPVNADGVRV